MLNNQTPEHRNEKELNRIRIVIEKRSDHFVHVDASNAEEAFRQGKVLFDVLDGFPKLKQFFSKRPELAKERAREAPQDAWFEEEGGFRAYFTVHKNYSELNLLSPDALQPQRTS